MSDPRDSSTLATALLAHLRASGPRSVIELCQALHISQPTFSRQVATLKASVLTVGRARATRYAALRSIGQLPAALPIYEVLPDRTGRLGTLHPIHPRGFYVESDSPLVGFYPDFPWFLGDLRPAGFLGRLVPRQHPALGFPADIRLWSADQVLVWIHDYGVDLVGDLIIGDPAFQRFLTMKPLNPVPSDARRERYPILAADALAAGDAGSSAGGEQPKFLATRMDGETATPVLVKFSPPVRDPVSRRLADLLRCEHLALAAVARVGSPAARSAIVEGGERVFLEVERFDRVSGTGRRGVVSLAALDDEFVGSRQSWTTTADALLAQKRIDRESHDRIQWLDRFGEWIGNTDRHHGNLSFFLERGRLGALAPIYDMLPMRYAPRSGELVDTPLSLPALSGVRPDLWRSSWAAAVAFWTTVAQAELSQDFLVIARANADLVASQEQVLDRLPG